MILSDAEIRRRLEDGDLDIEPLADPELQIQPASVDLRLGREFLEFERTNIPCIHPDSAEEVEDYVSETVVPEDEDFVVHPGDFVLGTTVERVDIPPDLIAHVEGRSSLGRLAVVVHASLPGDESVFLWTPSEGFGLYDIGEIVERERPARAVAFDPRTLRVSTHRVTDHITNPQKRIYRVELDSGRAVHVTRDHNLFTLDERGGVTRIPSEDAVGEQVMVPARLPGSPTPRERLDVLDAFEPGRTTLYASDGSGSPDRSTGLSESRDDHHSDPATVDRTDAGDVETTLGQDGTRLPRELRLTPGFGWLLGFSITAGSTHQGQLRVTSTDTASLDRFAAVLGTHDVDTSRHEDGRSTTLRVRSERWSAVVDELAGTGGERTIPETVFDWPETVQGAVLEGMLDGEGHNQTRDRLSTANPELADRAAYLGTRLGLSTAVHSNGQTADSPPGGDYETWVVEFGEDARGHDRVPAPGALLRTLRERAGMEISDAADAVDLLDAPDTTGAAPSGISDVESGARDTVERETLDRFREAYAGAGVDTTRLDQLLDGDVRFEAVVDVVETDRVEPTYDLEVQPGGQPIENFLAGRGGVFLSNTAGLCDPGYRGQITLELSNLGAAPVALSPGMRVSQLTFTELTSPAERPYGEDRGSKYQEQEGPQASRIGGDREFGGEQ